MNDRAVWPPLPLAEWRPTYETLHLWMQTVGKIRIATTALINHWWNSTLYLTANGLTTSPMPHGNLAFEIAFDFVDHQMKIDTSNGASRVIALHSKSSADFYGEVMRALHELNIDVHIWPTTVEMPVAVRLDQDRQHATYVPEHANRWWRITSQVALILEEFRSKFIGKCSPVHFFWGSFDLAVTRFSGRRAPPRNDPQAFMRESYSHEVSSAGFWPGSGPITDAAFYSYAAPAPEGFDRALPRYNRDLGEYILMYEEMRNAASPRDSLLDFLQTTYEAAATLGKWNRAELERS